MSEQDDAQGERPGASERLGAGGSDIPFRNPSVEAYQVEGGAVLHDSGRDRVFAVTALAGEIWERCDGNTSFEKISREIDELTEASSPDPAGSLRQVLTHLADQGLLFIRGADPANGSSPADSDLADGEEVTTLSVVFGNHQVRIETTDPECERATRRLFHGMLGRGQGTETIDMLTVRRTGDRYSVWSLQGHRAEEEPLENAIQSLKHTVLRRLMEARRDLLWLHAGAVARNETAVLLVGPSGSGKSTAVAELCRSGWKQMSDDLTPYDPDSRQAHSLPTTIAYRQPGGDRLSKEELLSSPKEHMHVESERLQDTPVRPEAIFFPTFEAGRPAEAEDLPTPEAAVSLIESCQNVGRYRGEALRELSRLASQVPSFRLRYNSQSDIPGLLTSAIG